MAEEPVHEETLEDLSKLTHAGEIEIVSDPVVRRYGLMYEVLEGYRRYRAEGMPHGQAMWSACLDWDV